MKSQHKGKRLTKLKYNIWFYLVIFALLIVAIIWIFQILLFDMIFQQRKIETLTSLGNVISSSMNTESNVTDDTVSGWLSMAVNANEAGIFSYVTEYDENGVLNIDTIISAYADFDEEDKLPQNGLQNGENGGVEVNVRNGSITDRVVEIVNTAISALEHQQQSYVCERSVNGSNDGYFYYVSRISNETIDGYLVLVSNLDALSETIRTIQSQLIIDSGVVVIISFFVAMYIAIRISKPIGQMSKTAKKWANGDENVTFVGNDFEELRELADALNYAKDGIAQTGVLQRDLLANVSHDLKTPLTMIKAYAEMIRDLSGDVKEKRDKHTKVIIDEADRLTMLVNDILDLSKLQNGMNTPDLKPVNLSELLNTVLFRMTEFAKNNGFTIKTDIDEDLCTICDSRQIEQVLYNLIGNSINYTGEDKTVCVRLKKKENVILFETIDSGKGISEEKIQTIWDKYYRFSETHQRPIKGTGLGLSIVKTILEGHKLKFGVISEKDVGSNFFIEFVEYDGQV